MTTLLAHRLNITKQLAPHSDSPRLDAELLMMCAAKKTRAALFANPHDTLSETALNQLNELVNRRIQGEPIAYLLGTQPFWTMDLMVTADTLIPRPETECLVEWILHHAPDQDNLQLADLGTGSGAIAIALAIERKNWKIDAGDQSAEALAIARKNALKYDANNISFYLINWCEGLPSKQYDLIVSNPPYIAEQDPHLNQLQFEPQTALVSGKEGLDDIKKIITETKTFLKPGGYLVIEHGYDQSDAVAKCFTNAEFKNIICHRDLSDTPRFVTGQL